MSSAITIARASDPVQNSRYSGLVLGIAGAAFAVAVAYEPVLLLALALVGILIGAACKRPALALKLMLLYGGIPLESLGHGDDPAAKPLFRDLGGTTVDGLILVVMTFTFVLVLFHFRPIRFPKYLRPYLLLVAFVAFTLLYSVARVDGLRLVLKLTYPLTIFLLALRFLKSKEDVLSALNYWIAGGLLSTVGGIALFVFRGIEAFLYNGDVRYSSGMMYYSAFSMYMFALFVLCYALWRNGEGWRYGALALLFGSQAMAGQTRITWAALLIGLLVLEATQGSGLRRLGRVVGLGSLMAVAGLYLIWQVPELQQRIFRSKVGVEASASEAVDDLDLSSRGLVWGAVFLDYWTHNHWIGQGAGSSLPVLHRDFPPEVAAPHNEFLRLLHDAGIFGLLLFLAAITGLFLLVRTLLRPTHNTLQRLFARISLVLLAGYVITAITDNPLDYYLVFSQYVFFVLALAISASQWMRAMDGEPLITIALNGG